jgi:hypothetical protein
VKRKIPSPRTTNIDIHCMFWAKLVLSFLHPSATLSFVNVLKSHECDCSMWGVNYMMSKPQLLIFSPQHLMEVNASFFTPRSLYVWENKQQSPLNTKVRRPQNLSSTHYKFISYTILVFTYDFNWPSLRQAPSARMTQVFIAEITLPALTYAAIKKI